jgi:ribose 5-phosphate isomerase B
MSDVDEARVRRLVREAVERALSAAPPGEGATTRSSTAEIPGGTSAARRVALGSDHGGFALKEILEQVIPEELGWEVLDCGTHSAEAVDYPDFAAAVAREVAGGRCSRGIVIDAAGIGSAMAANKIAGVRCAVCHDAASVQNAREHNDANLMSIGARFVNRGLAVRMARLFLTLPFAGGRHERRVLKIMALERGR